jgi:aspartyl-tRNA(Asn)/glutamyl-tRNA(Gln) amidotransferase subunit A
MSDMLDWSACRMADALRGRTISAVELLDAHLERIEQRNEALNAIVIPRFEEARREAKAADKRLSRDDPAGPLDGVPFTVKDPIPVGGMPAPNGSKLWADHRSKADCAAVRALREAGAILLGKTNVSELSMHWDSVNELFGATRNPHDPSRTAGGSSGGEAAAISSGMSPLGIGSDLGGSIRNPCSFTGIVGMKPGRDTVPIAGHHPLRPTPGIRMMGTLGPMARTVDSLELAMDVLAPALAAAARPSRIVAFEEDGLQPVAEHCRQAVRQAAGALRDAGYEVVEDALPSPTEVRRAYDDVLIFEVNATLAPQIDGRQEQLSPPLAATLIQLRMVAPPVERYLTAWTRLAELEQEADGWLRGGVGLSPVAPSPAPALRGAFEVDGHEMRPGGKLTLSTYQNALGLPAVCVPVGTTAAGLPLGVQLFGRRGTERTLLALAHLLESALGGWVPPPAPAITSGG